MAWVSRQGSPDRVVDRDAGGSRTSSWTVCLNRFSKGFLDRVSRQRFLDRGFQDEVLSKRFVDMVSRQGV